MIFNFHIIYRQYIRQLAKQWGLGAIAYKLYYAPKSFLEKISRQGSINIAIDYLSRLQMEAAADKLPTVAVQTSALSLDIYFLSGRKFWYQTCFCAYSMQQHTNLILRPIIYDDSSLDQQYQKKIKRIFPHAEIILLSEVEERLEQYLPQSKFPYLRERRLNYPNLKKLTDIHIGSQGWKLVLDSDMLFFHPPDLLIEWLKSPQQPCHMVDVETSYGYSQSLMSSLAQAEIPERLNVGICGLKSENIDWEKLEYWCKKMIEQQGTHYYQEQALIAMLMSSQPCTVAPATDYVVLPNQAEVIQPKVVLHHYVSESKSWYFRYGWKHIISSM
ncbi:hypothetical protein NIES21_43850 [Anabaenopsis circularis NIES-21]|uniref:Glycosyl transferase n=1 Tax=Anabaenopsis circularis NIES-21 TaxID=1085406 RepID=A0A1Z4GMF8_9CYAN|nr:hypothetical protein NIES21_43850 [Anabaenopsis circularis NIES-21]